MALRASLKGLKIGFVAGLVGGYLYLKNMLLTAFWSEKPTMPLDTYSPDGLHKVIFESYEMKMSHEVHQPRLIRNIDDTCLFSLNFDDWSAWEVWWLDDSTVWWYMRRYPGLVSCTVELNVKTFHAQGDTPISSVKGTFQEVKAWVRALGHPTS